MADPTGVTPYLEVRTLAPSRARRLLAFITAALLVMPVGALLPGGSSEPLIRIAAIVAIALLAPVLGLALARPRQFLTVDAQAGTIALRTTGDLPDPRAQTASWPISAARRVELEQLGSPARPRWGVRIDLTGDEPLWLNSYADRDLAQDTVDHLALLGLPGTTRADLRAGELTAQAPVTWL